MSHVSTYSTWMGGGGLFRAARCCWPVEDSNLEGGFGGRNPATPPKYISTVRTGLGTHPPNKHESESVCVCVCVSLNSVFPL